MNAHVLNGIRGPQYQGFTSLSRPATVGALKLAALQTIRDGNALAASLNGWEGYPTDYASMVARARQVADGISDAYPGWSIAQLNSVPLPEGLGAFWDDVSAVTQNVINENSWLKDIGKYNPALIPVRAAVLEIVKANIGGAADTMLKGDQNNIRTQWLYNGGNWTDLVKAMQQGKGRVNGITGDDMFPRIGPMGFTPYDAQWWLGAYGIGDPNPYPTNNPAFNGPTTSPTPPQGATPPINNQQGGGSTWGTIWDIAAPLVNSLLGGAATAAGDAITHAINPNAPPRTPPAAPPVRATPVITLRPGRTSAPNKPKPKPDNTALYLLGGGALLLALSKH